MTRLELIFATVFIGASSYFALWGCFPNCGTVATPCGTDTDCAGGTVCSNSQCVTQECAAAEPESAVVACQASSVALGGQCTADTDCATNNTGDSCVLGKSSAPVCVKAEAPGAPGCDQAGAGFVDVTTPDIAGTNDIHFCASGAVTCTDPGNLNHGRCSGG